MGNVKRAWEVVLRARSAWRGLDRDGRATVLAGASMAALLPVLVVPGLGEGAVLVCASLSVALMFAAYLAAPGRRA